MTVKELKSKLDLAPDDFVVINKEFEPIEIFEFVKNPTYNNHEGILKSTTSKTDKYSNKILIY